MTGDGYTIEHVRTLLGFHEGLSDSGERHITVVDIVSLARSPGGMAFAREDDADGWMAQRGLEPDSALACTLYDFERAMKTLSLDEQAIVALTVFDFSQEEIGQLLGKSQGHVSKILKGRRKRDADGKPMLDDNGDPLYHGGVVRKIAASMNNGTADG